jgi:lipid-A-disaccharide synthase-like uncharacterized protein
MNDSSDIGWSQLEQVSQHVDLASQIFWYHCWCLVSDLELLAMAIVVVFVCPWMICYIRDHTRISPIIPHNTRHTSLHGTRVTLFFIVIKYTIIFIVVLGVIFCATQILDYTSALLIQSIDLDSTERNLS